jgi:hypothetical protein
MARRNLCMARAQRWRGPCRLALRLCSSSARPHAARLCFVPKFGTARATDCLIAYVRLAPCGGLLSRMARIRPRKLGMTARPHAQENIGMRPRGSRLVVNNADAKPCDKGRERQPRRACRWRKDAFSCSRLAPLLSRMSAFGRPKKAIRHFLIDAGLRRSAAQRPAGLA